MVFVTMQTSFLVVFVFLREAASTIAPTAYSLLVAKVTNASVTKLEDVIKELKIIF